MIEKGDVATEYEPYTEDAPLLEYVLQNKKLIEESNKVLLNIPIDKVYIQINATGGIIERDFGIDVPKEDDAEETYRIVTTMRGNSLKGMISIESPLGKALMGHKVGDRVLIQVNDSYSYYVVIRAIENTPEDESETLRKF